MVIIAEPSLKYKVTNLLERHHGRHSAISRREIRNKLHLDNKEDRKLRLLVAELRREGLPVMFATEKPGGYYLPETLAELKEGMDKMRSYIIQECIVLRNYRVLGSQYLNSEKQGRLI